MIVTQDGDFSPKKLPVNDDEPARLRPAPADPLIVLEGALREAEAARDAARIAWLQAGTENVHQNQHLSGVYQTNSGVAMGVQWAIDLLTGARRV